MHLNPVPPSLTQGVGQVAYRMLALHSSVKDLCGASIRIMKKFIYAIATLSGTIIGVGLFSLPYITSQVGIWVMLGYFLVLGGIVILTQLLFAEVALHTPDFMRLPGYAKFYLGKWGHRIALISTIFGFWGAILAYLIIGGKFLTFLLSPILGGSDFLYTVLYFFFGAVLIHLGIKTIAKVEVFGLVIFFIILAVIFFHGFPLLKLNNLFPKINWEISFLFLPYGPILFSLWGADLIPEIEEMLGRKKTLLKKIIPIAIIIPIIFYIIFIFLVLGVTGKHVSVEAIDGLAQFLGADIIRLAIMFGILTTFTSFITLGLTLKKVFWYDLKISKDISWVITCFVPLSLFVIGFNDFIEVISLVGGVLMGVSGILIILMYRVCKKITRFSFTSLSTSFLIFFFILGIVYNIYYFTKS